MAEEACRLQLGVARGAGCRSPTTKSQRSTACASPSKSRALAATPTPAPALAGDFCMDCPIERERALTEVLEAVTSLSEEQLRPYGRLVRKRLAERAEEAGTPPVGVDLGRLRALCEECPGLVVEADSEADWAVLIKGSSPFFVDIYTLEDNYPPELWADFEAYLESLADDELLLSGGRYIFAKTLVARRLPFLEGLSLGRICHIVQLAMSQRRLLGYLNGAIVPYGRSQTRVKDQCAENHELWRKSKLPLATWDGLRECLTCMLEEASRASAAGGLPLSNVKRVLRSRYQVDLSETSLGHSTVSDLFKDDRMQDLCTIKLLDNGYFVFPVSGVVSTAQDDSSTTAAGSENGGGSEEATLKSESGSVGDVVTPPSVAVDTGSPLPRRRRGGAAARRGRRGVGCNAASFVGATMSPEYAASADSATAWYGSPSMATLPAFSPTEVLRGSSLATTPLNPGFCSPPARDDAWDMMCSVLGMPSMQGVDGESQPSPYETQATSLGIQNWQDCQLQVSGHGPIGATDFLCTVPPLPTPSVAATSAPASVPRAWEFPGGGVGVCGVADAAAAAEMGPWLHGQEMSSCRRDLAPEFSSFFLSTEAPQHSFDRVNGVCTESSCSPSLQLGQCGSHIFGRLEQEAEVFTGTPPSSGGASGGHSSSAASTGSERSSSLPSTPRLMAAPTPSPSWCSDSPRSHFHQLLIDAVDETDDGDASPAGRASTNGPATDIFAKLLTPSTSAEDFPVGSSCAEEEDVSSSGFLSFPVPSLARFAAASGVTFIVRNTFIDFVEESRESIARMEERRHECTASELSPRSRSLPPCRTSC
eukprot:TRINITY_DN13607_c0_g1_i1.p1 TRINITY_DN13607_c0_g1~~TRINITY_DN13607_c0_g1_i1.p1  ORF type:complete len:850 (+),score=168.28 TRINITY_DN13607_c0_g1_i1:93-2552(+)